MKPTSVVVLTGTDEFQKRLLIDEIRKELFPNGSTGFNDDKFESKERSTQEIIDLCNTLPMLAERRMVTIRNLDTLNEADLVKWIAYFEKPSPQTTLLITCNKLDKRTKLAKVADQLGFVRQVEPPPFKELNSWVEKISKKHSVSFQTDAKEELIDCIGNNLALLDQQIEKLALFVHPEKTVTKDAVTKLVLQSTGDHIFAWTDQVLEGKLILALSTLNYLLNDGNPPLVVLSMLVRHIRILMKAKDLVSRKVPTREMAPELGVPPFVVNKYVEQARQFSFEKIESMLSELALLDHELKSTGLEPKMLLERAVFKLQGSYASR